eukprot:1034117-Amphidinium_carterae.1
MKATFELYTTSDGTPLPTHFNEKPYGCSLCRRSIDSQAKSRGSYWARDLSAIVHHYQSVHFHLAEWSAMLGRLRGEGMKWSALEREDAWGYLRELAPKEISYNRENKSFSARVAIDNMYVKAQPNEQIIQYTDI